MKTPSNNAHFNEQMNTLTEEKATESNAIQIPEISLPKGGGALKGIDEKFEVNAANGTAGFNIPVPLTSGRNGFSPALSLNYNSGNGNGLYGLGWSVDYPIIQRKTDKKIPRYRDGLEEDVFMFSGAEDLVPCAEETTANGEAANAYEVKRYQPRIEGEFARIEKIDHQVHGTYWKVTTRENIATIFGRSEMARIADPQDISKIFKWLPEFSYDDKGNWIAYKYKAENLGNVPNQVYEKNRKSGLAPFANTYLKRAVYGNQKAYYADPASAYDPQAPEDDQYFFEVLMDYGEHDVLKPTPEEKYTWTYREDPFSSYRSGFEIRTNRLCKRILMFHHFENEEQVLSYDNNGTGISTPFGKNYLVRSLDLEYEPSAINSSGQTEINYLKSISQCGYIRKANSSYAKKTLPPMEFSYEKLHWNKSIKTISQENIANAPVGLTNNYQWIDLYGEGISGIITEQAEGWFYKSNRGDASFTRAQQVIPKPSFSGLSNSNLSIQDLAANGEKQVVVNSANLKGYFELTHDNNWKPFQPFEQIANIDLQDPNTRLLDLNGDGQAELVMTEENVFVWYAADGKRGYLPAEYAAKTFDEEQGPTAVFADQEQSIFLADLSGDGLTDIVRIRNGEVCYWANMGYGHFSAKLTMGNAPVFDHPDLFNPQYLHLADVSGTGATDLIYLGKNKFKAYINLTGNAWSDEHEIDPFFPIDRNSRLSVVDLLGTGTSCIVWSSDLPAYANAPMRYIDLMDSKKPHLLIHYENNFGKETTIDYKSSTHFYLADKLAGKPWISKLPFPVQVVIKQVIKEKITDLRFTSEYRYHHGYYDHPEREFRGFGLVEQIDSEHYAEWHKNNETNQLEKEEALYQKPMLTKTWYHTGAFLDRERILNQFEKEYWHEEYNKVFPLEKIALSEPELSDASLTDEVKALSGDEFREALRACKSMILRQEVFALDAPETPSKEDLQRQLKPYTVTTHNCHIQLLQPRGRNPYGVFLVTESEAITIQYERDETDYRLTHTLNTRIDELGNILEMAAVVYSRDQAKANADFQSLSGNVSDFSNEVLNNDPVGKTQLLDAFNDNIAAAKKTQTRIQIIYTQNSFARYHDGTDEFEDIDLPHAYRLRLPYETKTYEITDLDPKGNLFQLQELETILADAAEIPYHEEASGDKQKRLIEHIKTKYRDDDLTEMSFGFFDTLALPFESYQLAYTPELVKEIYTKGGGTELIAEGDPVSDLIETKGKYSSINGLLWIRSGRTHYKVTAMENQANIQDRFFSPIAYEDPFGAKTTVVYDRETFTGNTRNNDGYYLFIKASEDTVANKTQIDRFNFRTFSPSRMIDINANPSSIIVDELGLVKALAVEGNGLYSDASKTSVTIIQAADNLADLTEYTDEEESDAITQFFDAATYKSTNTEQLRTAGNHLLQSATTRFVYDFDGYKIPKKRPVTVASITREEHFADNNTSAIQFTFDYSDGLGNVVMTKAQAEPGWANYMENGQQEKKDTGTDLRWLGNGRTILNNKGNPVRQYEPYFSTNFLYEDESDLVETGVTPVLYYDALGRLIKTKFPNGTLSRLEFDSWKRKNFDQNDTVLEEECLWYKRRTDASRADFISNAKEQEAAQKTVAHANTPSSLYLDVLGRPVLSIAHNGKDATDHDRLYSTFIELDIEGNARAVIDARGNAVVTHQYDMLGHRVYENSMDAGERWVLNNVMGNPVYRWDNRDHVFSYNFDVIQRPERIKVHKDDGANSLDHIYDRVIYGEGQSNEYEYNLRGQVFQQYDTAGRIQNLRFDFKGNALELSREVNTNYKEVPDWIDANLNNLALFDPDHKAYKTFQDYDALNRNIQTKTPDDSLTAIFFNERGLLKQIKVTQTAIAEKLFVKEIIYDAKGQREKIIYGDKDGNNLASTIYKYDEETFRLIHLKTNRTDGKLLQDLYYTYDPVGNITEVEDKAIPAKFFNNLKIEGKGIYTYDALYRLITAKGREHAGQAIDFNTCDNWKDKAFLTSYSPNDEMTWRKYTQKYTYDPVGNILKTKHEATDRNWTRHYEYETQNNRLKQTEVGGHTYTYPHHTQHGFIESLPHLQLMNWNFKDELQATATQKICTGIDPEITYYIYDANGQRVRKVTENHGGGSKKEERIYLGAMVVYKKHALPDSGLERTTLHIMDDTRRIAMIDTRNEVNDDTDQRTVRFQFNNHLGSASWEMDDEGRVISYEEYHPYGTTAYQAVNKTIKAVAKRFRYTGMERDEESGLNYHSARYYLLWLGRWLKPDPEGILDGLNLYGYVNSNPVKFKDTTGTTGEYPPALRAAWDAAEAAGYDDASLENLKHVIDQTYEFGTRSHMLEYGAANATAGVRAWDRGDYARGAVLQGAAVVESLGVGYGMFGDTQRETVARMTFQAVTGAILGRLIRGGGSSSRPAPGAAPRPAAPAAAPRPAAPAAAPRPAAPAAPRPPAAAAAGAATTAGRVLGSTRGPVVYGPSAGGALRRLTERLRGVNLNDLVPRAGIGSVGGWARYSISILNAALRGGRRIVFDLTHIRSLRGVLRNAGPHAARTTSIELRYIRDNWHRFREAVTFMRNGRVVRPPWVRPPSTPVTTTPPLPSGSSDEDVPRPQPTRR